MPFCENINAILARPASSRKGKVWDSWKFASLANRRKHYSYPACLILPVLFCLSDAVSLVLPVLCWQSRSYCTVQFCVSRAAFPALPVLFACPTLSFPFCLSFLSLLSWMSCPGRPISAFLSWQTDSGSPVLPVAIWLSVLPVLFYLLCYAYPILPLPLPILLCLSCSASPGLPVLFWLSRFACPVLAVPLWLSHFGCPMLAVPP
jgi:hypothetical protein